MLIKHKKVWDINHRDVTPEAAFLSRRQLIAAGSLGLGSIAAGGLMGLGGIGTAKGASAPVELSTLEAAALHPAPRNPAYTLDRELTPEKVNLSFNNFYEFGSHKSIARAAQALKIDPWQVRIDGEVEKEITMDVQDLIKKMGVEERLYRLRCVEAWSMTIPWSGFALSKLVAMAKPLSTAKYLRMETFLAPDVARNQRQVWLPWPYTEALTIAEATNEVAFLACGAYGKTLAKQLGAPLRLAVPWKYGFKSIKSIVRFSFVEHRPMSFWQRTAGEEYGFWANVNPEVPHPRWSQARERILHTGERVPTLLFNGYAEQVADLYKGLEEEMLYR